MIFLVLSLIFELIYEKVPKDLPKFKDSDWEKHKDVISTLKQAKDEATSLLNIWRSTHFKEVSSIDRGI